MAKGAVNHNHHQESEAILQAVLEAASEIAAIVAIDGTFLQVSSAGAAMALVDGSGDLTGRKLFEFIAPKIRHRPRRPGRRCGEASPPDLNG